MCRPLLKKGESFVIFHKHCFFALHSPMQTLRVQADKIMNMLSVDNKYKMHKNPEKI
jgi:hypothetical protein